MGPCTRSGVGRFHDECHPDDHANYDGLIELGTVAPGINERAALNAALAEARHILNEAHSTVSPTDVEGRIGPPIIAADRPSPCNQSRTGEKMAGLSNLRYGE